MKKYAYALIGSAIPLLIYLAVYGWLAHTYGVWLVDYNIGITLIASVVFSIVGYALGLPTTPKGVK